MLVPRSGAPEDLRNALADLLEHERAGEEHTAIAQQAGEAERKSPYDRIAELGFGARVLFDDRGGDPAMVGIVAVERQGEKAALVPPQLATAIAEALAERGDVDPMTCFA